jgi:hypothetical protein
VTAALRVFRLLAVLAACAVVAACGSVPSSSAEAAVVVGVTTDMAIGAEIDRLRITMRVDGAVLREEDLFHVDGDLKVPLELWLDRLHHDARVDIVIDAFAPGSSVPHSRRVAATRAAGGRTLLLPVTLSLACTATAASCATPQTCADGVCTDPFVDPSALEDFDPAWVDRAPDACKLPERSEPMVIVGRGHSEYTELDEGDSVSVEAGPQGGHHVWLSVRTQDLRQTGSVLTVRGFLPELGAEVPPAAHVVTFHRAGEGLCELYGLRFQVDRDVELAAVLGQRLDLEIAVEDETGDIGRGTKTVIVAAPRHR